jgi:hypothetical protein
MYVFYFPTSTLMSVKIKCSNIFQKYQNIFSSTFLVIFRQHFTKCCKNFVTIFLLPTFFRNVPTFFRNVGFSQNITKFLELLDNFFYPSLHRWWAPRDTLAGGGGVTRGEGRARDGGARARGHGARCSGEATAAQRAAPGHATRLWQRAGRPRRKEAVN